MHSKNNNMKTNFLATKSSCFFFAIIYNYIKMLYYNKVKENIMKKKEFGQYYTTTNPFNHELFYKWVNEIEDFSEKKILEPFCGSNNIVNMIEDLGFF